ncbi:non-heme iron oxygenase ferredoxin subunit [uncultured Methylibium sp.]|uniref:non-heme iron oxygenase ferredoxin subunit n=1 Tax=uncultured Methylibium sp. TaxID=381093 RepID=UPI0025D6DA4F|nr:non-heme iron oxygenase ferredoxin subunit [uncultured Methylibium sp.]
MSEAHWHDAGPADAVPDGEVVGCQLAGRQIALARLGSECFAFDAWCTHGQAALTDGFVEADGSIECPLHQGRFDIRSGKALCEPLEQHLQTFALKIEDGRVWVRLG